MLNRDFVIRRNTFLSGIVIGVILGFVYDQTFRWAIVGGFMGGNFLGAVGEGIVTRETSDILGAGCVLGFFAALCYIVFRNEYSFLLFVWCAGLWASFSVLGWLGHKLGNVLSSILTKRDANVP